MLVFFVHIGMIPIMESVLGIPEINLQKYNQFDHSGQRSTIHTYYSTGKKATEDSTLWMETGHWWYDCGKFYLSEPLILSCLHLNAAGLERTSSQGLHCSKVSRKDTFLWLATRYGGYDYGNVIRINCMLPTLHPEQFSVYTCGFLYITTIHLGLSIKFIFFLKYLLHTSVLCSNRSIGLLHRDLYINISIQYCFRYWMLF